MKLQHTYFTSIHIAVFQQNTAFLKIYFARREKLEQKIA